MKEKIRERAIVCGYFIDSIIYVRALINISFKNILVINQFYHKIAVNIHSQNAWDV